MSIFHLAIPTHDLSKAKNFYQQQLGASVGREYSQYIIYNFFSHQLVTHLDESYVLPNLGMYPKHYGIIFKTEDELDSLYKKLQAKKLNFFQEKFERFKNKTGWHKSFFIADPSNNLLEFKYYFDEAAIY